MPSSIAPHTSPTAAAGVPGALFAHSYLGMGMDSALARATEVVLLAQKDTHVVHDPCLPLGFAAEDGRKGNASFTHCLQVRACTLCIMQLQ